MRTPLGSGLVGACQYYGLQSSDATYKDTMRQRILKGPPFFEQEKKDIISYCQKDVEMTEKLFLKMKNQIDLPFALLRGRYMAAIAQIEFHGVPIDVNSLHELQSCWDIIREELIWRVDQQYNVFEGTVFKIKKFDEYLKKHQIPWEYTPEGYPRTDDEYMENKAMLFPQLQPLRELRCTLSQLKLKNLQIGDDGRNRCLLSPFRAKTGRNQPSSAKFIFGPAVWLRSLIKPFPGTSLAYIDYEQQEIGIAAALSADKNLINAYCSGDPYIAFAKKAGAIPPEGTKKSHPEIRELYKRCMLALNYGMSTETFARQVQIPLSEAKAIIRLHKQTYRRYWEWNQNFVDTALLSGLVKTNHNWYFRTGQAKPRTLMNFPMQSHGADILRLAICLCIEHGVKVVAPVHDAILIEASNEDIKNKVTVAQQCMEDASEYVLNFRIRTDVKIIEYPDRYIDPRGKEMWDRIWSIINDMNPAEKQTRIYEKQNKDISLDYWEPKILEKPLENLSKKRRSQQMMKLDFNEKMLLEQLKKKTNFSHMELVHLIRISRDSDYDLEMEIDWKHQGYNSIKEKILKDIGIKQKTASDLPGDIL